MPDPETARVLAKAREDADRLRLTTIAYWQHLTESLARERARAVNPVCPCCHRPMTT